MIKKKSLLLPLTLLLVVLVFIMIHDLLGGSFLDPSPYNSYTRQALAWRKGQFYLDQDYPWLELAIYGGHYYVSFPPVPSLIMLPLTFFFGVDTPDNVVALAFCLLIITAVYLACRKSGASDKASIFLALFYTLGSNLFWMSTDGSVWFLAQSLNMVFCTFAIYFAVRDLRMESLLFIALAIGCRPFSCLLFLPILIMFIEKDIKEDHLVWWKAALSQWKYLIGAAIICLVYFLFNYLRFHNPFEFGHSYLPEFNRGEPQFSATFILKNLRNILRPVTFRKNLTLNYSVYDGFLFLLANPFLIFALSKLRHAKEWTIWQWTSLGCMIINLVLLLMHRTFGGWQFGARYTVDLMSYGLLFCIPYLKNPIKNWQLVLGGFAIAFNLYGAMAMHLMYS